MAKQGMKRIDPRDPKSTQDNHWQNLPRNDMPPVPERRGKDKAKFHDGADNKPK